jgi:hypothetical protein
MRYLGNISGRGMLKCNGEEVARASYCFEGFFKESTGVTSCGEIRLSATVLKDVFGHKDIQLLTDNGRLFNLKFSELKLPEASDVAHVDVTGDLPSTLANLAPLSHLL